MVEKLELPTAGDTVGLFEYYYKHFRYYQHGMPENAEDPEAAIDLQDILATFGLAEARVRDTRKTLNLTEGMGVNSSEVAHSDQAHSELAHSDLAYSDMAHSEVAHSEVEHSEVAH